MQWIYHAVRYFLVHWGYLAIVIGVMGEDTGLPLPGETVLVFASFLAHKGTGLQLYWVIPVGMAAATLGDNLGFLVGRKLGPTLLRWMKKILRLDDEDERAAKDLIRRRGGSTIFFARFIFGLRTVAGPLAGMLGMEWKRFLLFNFLGAATWATSVCLIGYAFASQFNTLLSYFETAGWALAAGLFTLGYVLWRRHKKQYRKRHQQDEQAA